MIIAFLFGVIRHFIIVLSFKTSRMIFTIIWFQGGLTYQVVIGVSATKILQIKHYPFIVVLDFIAANLINTISRVVVSGYPYDRFFFLIYISWHISCFEQHNMWQNKRIIGYTRKRDSFLFCYAYLSKGIIWNAWSLNETDVIHAIILLEIAK